MSLASTGKNIIGITALAAAGMAGLAASLYAIVIAYVAGAEAQAAVDEAPAADPAVLARVSLAKLTDAINNPQSEPPIDVDESTVDVSDVWE